MGKPRPCVINESIQSHFGEVMNLLSFSTEKEMLNNGKIIVSHYVAVWGTNTFRISLILSPPHLFNVSNAMKMEKMRSWPWHISL